VRTNGWIVRGASPAFITRPLGRAAILPPNLDGLRSFNISLPPGVAALLPPAPVGLQAHATGDTTIDLSWQAMSQTMEGFRIEHSRDGIAYTAALVISSNATSVRVQNLKAGIRHRFRIRAINSAGESPPSNVAEAFTWTPFQQWRFTHFPAELATNNAVSGPAADPDQDGLSNFGEFTFAGDPNQRDADGLITTFIDRSANPNGVLAAGYSRQRQAAEAAIQARVADSFDSSLRQSTNVITPVIIGQTETEITEVVLDTVAVPSAPRRAMKLEAINVGLPDVWETLPDLPFPLKGAAGGVIGQRLYVVGGGTNATLAFDVPRNQWTNLSAARPFVSSYHSAEVISNRLYLIGGLSSSAGKMQIFNPESNSWTLGPPVPYPVGACATCVISDMLYLAAPDPGNPLRNVLARYSLSENRWTTNLPGMPQARILAAAGTDGAHFFLFGGRSPSGANNDGTDTVQIYDPISNSWSSSDEAGSWIRPLPQARTGPGKAIYRDGRFYVMGGQTTFGFGATPEQTYNRVDIYYVALNEWSAGTPMLTARHGFAAMLGNGRIYTAGGGTTGGDSGSTVFELYFP